MPAGATGQNVRVGIVDRGFFPHPYYAANQFAYMPTPTPLAQCRPMTRTGTARRFVQCIRDRAEALRCWASSRPPPPQDALEEAADAGVDIISCSWGWDHEQSFPTIELTIRDVVREGKIVLFATGNGQHAWPGSMPEVISIGGVFAARKVRWRQATYASGYTSDLYPNRKVPDVCGLCGQKPRAVYIMMPCPPNCEMDRQPRRPVSFPDKDETASERRLGRRERHQQRRPRKIAGVVALMVEKARTKNPRGCSPARMCANILQTTGVPVQTGNNAQGFPAVGHPNVAVGHGLIDATAALAQV